MRHALQKGRRPPDIVEFHQDPLHGSGPMTTRAGRGWDTPPSVPNLATNLTDSAQRDAGRIALKLDDLEIPYGMLDELSARTAALLASKGVGPGDRVGIMLPNVPHFAAAYYGTLRAGAVVVPMNVLLKGREVAYYLKDSGAKILLAWEGFAEDAQKGAEEAGCECLIVEGTGFMALLHEHEPATEVVDRDASDTAVILYTSGTTGQPKGAELTHSNLMSNVDTVVDLFPMRAEDTVLGALPLFHSFGQTCGLNAAVKSGATLTLIPRFEPGKALEILERDEVTIFEGVPTMYGALLNHPDADTRDTSKLKRVRLGRRGAAG